MDDLNGVEGRAFLERTQVDGLSSPAVTDGTGLLKTILF